MLGVWLVCRVMNPWVVSAVGIRQLEKTGPSYYKATPRSGELHSCVEQACQSIRLMHTKRARIEIDAGRKLDPANPVFDYLSACIAKQQNDIPLALKHIRAGNARGSLRLYVDGSAPPEDWFWLEVKQISYLARDIASARPRDVSALVPALEMAHKLVWANPPDSARLLQAVEARRSVAFRLRDAAREGGDRATEKLCDEIISETRSVLLAEDRHMADVRTGAAKETRAWIIARSVGRQAGKNRRLLMLYSAEKHAEWADQLRRDYVHVRNLEGLP